MGDHNDRLLWGALLKQAETNLETARATHLQIQHMMCKESAIDMEPDRLEAWYVTDRDAEAGADIGRQIVHKGFAPPISKYADGSEQRAPSVLELLIASKTMQDCRRIRPP